MTPLRSVPLVMASLLLTAAIGLALRPLTPIDETRYLAVAWEMHQSGNWFVPTKNFALYSDKPPLLFWAINLMWWFTGVTEFAARMVGPLFGCAAIWLTAILGRRLWPDEARIEGRAALALAGLAMFALSSGLTMFDVPLAVCTLLGLIALSAAGRDITRRRPWLGLGAAIALGVLTKGPVILFHLLPAALLLPLWSANPVGWRQMPARLGLALLTGGGLLALWLVPAAILGGAEYRAAILWHQSAGRLTESFAHARPWWFFLALLPLLTFPLFWSPGLWRALWTGEGRGDRGLRLCLIWAGGALVLFSLTSGKQVHYLVPELPAMALVAARLMRDPARLTLWPAAALLGLAAAIAALAGLGLVPLGQLQPLLEPRLALLGCAVLIAAICWLALRRQGLAGAAILSLGGLLAANLLIGLTATASIYSTAPIAQALAAHQQDGLAFAGGTYHAEFNFAGRLTAPVALLPDAAARATWAASHPDGLIVGRLDRAASAGPPQQRFLFRNRDWGIWRAADALAPAPKE